MFKNIFKIIVIFIIGIAGGILGGQILTKYQSPNSIPVSVVENKEIIIQENTALQEAIEKIEKSIVGIRVETEEGKTVLGSGLVVTSDGLVVTLSGLVPQGAKPTFFIDGKTPEYQILKRDREKNLVLLKLKEGELQTCGFADFSDIRLGQRVFLLGMIFPKSGRTLMANQGIIKYFTEDYIRTNIFESYTLAGSALFNIKGELVGLNTIDSQGRVTAIPINVLRDFLGL